MAFSVATRRRLGFRVETPGADALPAADPSPGLPWPMGLPRRFLNRGGMRAVGSKRALGCSRGERPAACAPRDRGRPRGSRRHGSRARTRRDLKEAGAASARFPRNPGGVHLSRGERKCLRAWNTLRISGRCDSNVSCRRAPGRDPTTTVRVCVGLRPWSTPQRLRPRGPDSPACERGAGPIPSMASIGAHDALVEQFVAQGEGATGRAAADFVEQATSAPGLFAFGELLDLEGIDRRARPRAWRPPRPSPGVRARHPSSTAPRWRAAPRSPRSPPRRSSSSRSSPSPPWLSAPRRSATTISWPRSRCPRFVSSKTSSSTSASAPVSPAANSTSAARVSRCTRPSAAISGPGQLPEPHRHARRVEGKRRARRYGTSRRRFDGRDAQAKASRRKDEVDAEVAATIRTIKAEAEEAGHQSRRPRRRRGWISRKTPREPSGIQTKTVTLRRREARPREKIGRASGM